VLFIPVMYLLVSVCSSYNGDVCYVLMLFCRNGVSSIEMFCEDENKWELFGSLERERHLSAICSL